MEQLLERLTFQEPIALLMLLQDHRRDHLQHHAAKEDAHLEQHLEPRICLENLALPRVLLGHSLDLLVLRCLKAHL